MKTTAVAAAVLGAVCARGVTGAPEGGPLWNGVAAAWLDSPGGSLEFAVETGGKPGFALVRNADEAIEVPLVLNDRGELVIRFEEYDSEIVAAPVGENGLEFRGEWTKRRGPAGDAREWVKMPFFLNARGYCPVEADRGGADRTMGQLVRTGRWSVKFADDPEPAVLVMSAERVPDGRAGVRLTRATFLTTTGDYRYLTPKVGAGTLSMSCFDGSHAFLFSAKVAEDGSLTGDFWSGPSYHTTWTATPDLNAALPDGFGTAKVVPGADINALSYPDAKGEARSLGEPALVGKARIIEVFGTWCPNCRDASKALETLQAKYGGRGLKVVGLAFEVTGDRERDLKQLRVYAERLGVTYPLLLAGTNDKAKAREAFPVLEKIGAYPTLLFVDAAGRVRRTYSGFNGPATGAAHTEMMGRFETLIEKMLAE